MIRNVDKFLMPLCLAISLNVGVAGNVAAADAEQCDACHGANGVSADSAIPTIAGLSAAYTVAQMDLYKESGRPCKETKALSGPKKDQADDMCKIAKALSADDTAALAEHYAGQTYVRAKQAFNAAQVANGKVVHDTNCKKCHEDGGSLADDDAGYLAGQWTPYLKEQMAQYLAGERPMSEKMKPQMEKLSEKDIEYLLDYYASLQ